MKKKKHILVISQYFYPEQFRINDICQEWIKRGYQVTVLTGIPNYPEGKYYKGYGLFHRRNEYFNGIHIIRIPIVARGHHPILLIMNYLSFVISGFLWCMVTKVHTDIVFIYEVSPMTQALPGIWYAKKRNIPSFIYITDLWPENVETVTGIRNSLIIKPISKMVDYIYKNSTQIFTSSNSFIKAIQKRNIEEKKLHFWPQYAEDFYCPYSVEPSHEILRDGIFNLIFAGNIGYAQGLEILPKVALYLKNKGYKVRFNMIGDGRFKDELIRLVKEADVKSYFHFISHKPAELIPQYIKACDAALIILSKSEVFAITIPAKLQSCMACGTPIILSADGEVQEIVKAAGCGVVGDAKDAIALAENIIKMQTQPLDQRVQMSENALIYSKKHFNKQRLLDEMDDYLLR